MSESPFFSVLVPTYNQAQYLGSALDSLLAQTDPDWEAIIVNDGSTDSTREVIDAYCRKDTRFRAFHKENGGVASALNMGLREARGKWICWLSSDDLFERTKIEIHRQWIAKYPDCHFFLTRARYLHESTHTVEDPKDRIPINREWQLLEMLRCNYVGGNSVCVHHNLWAEVGMFDERLHYGQDYDMWLRLMSRYPAMLIPERTCITRIHPLQCSAGFREATGFDAATVGINFVNQHSFPDLVPLVDLSDTRIAREALTGAINVAADPSAYLYRLGPNPALLFRILEWIWNCDNPELKRSTLKLIQRRAVLVSANYPTTAFQFLWKAVASASQLPQHEYTYEPVSPKEVADINYRLLEATGDRKAQPLLRYIMMNFDRQVPPNISARKWKFREVVILYHNAASSLDPVKDSGFQATLSVAKEFTRAGNMILLISWPGQGTRFVDGILYAGASDEKSLAHAVSSLSPVDMLISISLNDGSDMICSRRYLNLQGKPDEPASPDWLLDTLSSDSSRATHLDISGFTSLRASRLRMIFWFCHRPNQIKRMVVWMIARVAYIVYIIIRTIMANTLGRLSLIWHRIHGEPVTKWPSLLKGLWHEQQQKKRSK